MMKFQTIFILFVVLMLSFACSKQQFRTEYAPSDAQYSNQDLVRNFALIALRSEYSDGLKGTERKAKSVHISKWTGPIRYKLVNASNEDEKVFQNLAHRLQLLTNLKIEQVVKSANMIVSFGDKKQRSGIVENLEKDGISGAPLWLLKRWRDGNRNPCMGILATPPDGGRIRGAYIFIQDELRHPWRRLCIIEETVQSLGLINDSPEVRPSIFNDDQEFMDLTEHDEKLIKLLYAPEVLPRMTAQEVLPIIHRIVEKIN